MKYYVEVETIRRDGYLVLFRIVVDGPMPSAEISALYFARDNLVDVYPCRGAGRVDWYGNNDFGEVVKVFATSYGAQAQVREGIFIL